LPGLKTISLKGLFLVLKSLTQPEVAYIIDLSFCSFVCLFESRKRL